MNTNAVFWTAATVFATSWLAFEVLRRRPDVEVVGDSEYSEADRLAEDLHDDELDGANEPAGAAADGRGDAGDAGDAGGDAGDAGGDAGAAWDTDDRARRALEAHQAQQDTQRINAWKQKGTVGTKKARSLERRDRRRAYFEYVRQEAERERERLQIEEDMFGDIVAEEREQRQRRIEEAKQALEEASRLRRERETEERLRRNQRRAEIRSAISEHGAVELKGDEDIEISDESGALVLENGEFAVGVTPVLVEKLSAQLRAKGRLGLDEIRDQLAEIY